MLDDEVQVGEVRGDVVDVGDVERVAVQRPDRRALVYVDVSHAEFAARLEVPVRPRVVEPPAAGLAVPFGGVELDALQTEFLGVLAELVEAGLAVARVEVVVVGQLVGMLGCELERLVGLSEALVVELAEVRRLEDRMVDVAVVEEILHQAVAALVQVLLVGPHLGLRRKIAVVVVEAVDELLAVDVALVLRPRVPQGDVGVDDEVAGVVLLYMRVAPPFSRVMAVTTCGRA